MTGRLFISYRREDTKWAAGLIYQRLVAKFGQKCVFMDVSSIEGGTNYLQIIREMVASCDVCVALIGDKWWSASDPSGSRRLDDPTDLLRLEIASSAFPLYDRNPSTDVPSRLAGNWTWRRSTQHVLHSAPHPSTLLLPLIGDPGWL